MWNVMEYDVIMPRGKAGVLQSTMMDVELEFLAATLRGAEGTVCVYVCV